MHVYIGVAVAHRSNHFGEFLRPNLLANIITTYGHNARGSDRSS